MSKTKNLYVALAFLAPALLAVGLLRLWPALLSVHESLLAPRATTYSFDNYLYIFADPVFQSSVWTTLLFSIVVNPLQIAISLGLAILLNNKLPGTGFWRTLILLPVAIPASVSAVVWAAALRPDGLANAMLGLFGLGPQPFLTSPQQALACIVLVTSWIGVGYWMTILLAGLQDIPKSLYEAARIDGMNRWQQFINVTLPQLRRPLTFVLVADTVSNFLVFAPVQILTRGGPQRSTNLIMHEIYTRAFATGDKASAYAATVVLILLMLSIVAIQFRLMGDKGDD